LVCFSVISFSFDLFLSDIALIDKYEKSEETTKFVKNGYRIIPRVHNFYPKEANSLIFYTEVYNTIQTFGEEEFLITYSIERANTSELVGNFYSFSKQKAQKVIVLLSQFDITTLPSGNYKLNVTVRDKQNQVIAEQAQDFTRSNLVEFEDIDLASIDMENTFIKDIPEDKFYFYMQSLIPIATTREVEYIDNLIQTKNIEDTRKFFYNFWYNRNRLEPDKEWLVYKEKVDMVEKDYKTMIEHGFQTERGRVYLQCGKPNHIERALREQSSRPYEIWQYYVLEDQRDIIFVFYNRDLVTNDYELLHSNARGEKSNASWKSEVHRGNSFGNRISDFYDN